MDHRRNVLEQPRGIRRVASMTDCSSASRTNSYVQNQIGLSFEEHLKDYPSSRIPESKRRLSPNPTLINPSSPSPYKGLAMKKSKTVDDFSTFDVAVESYNVSSRVETELLPFLKGFNLTGGDDVDRSSSFGSVERSLSVVEEGAESRSNRRSEEDDECWGLDYTY